MLCFPEFIEKYVLSGGNRTRIFQSNPIPKVELNSFFFFIQTGPNTPLYANSSFSRYIFFLPSASVFFCRTSGGGQQKSHWYLCCTYDIYGVHSIRNIQKKIRNDKYIPGMYVCAEKNTTYASPEGTSSIYQGYRSIYSPK